MRQEQVKKILAQLSDHESRLQLLEGVRQATPAHSASGKQKTLREIVRGKKFKSGQEQVAAIVGYYEKILGQRIEKNKIKEEWANAKMNGTFVAMFLSRAKDTLIRIYTDDTCDLTQTGEEFFDKLINNESPDATFK